MPTKLNCQKHYPNIIEFWIEDDEIIEMPYDLKELSDTFNKLATSLLKQDIFLSLLSTFTNSLFFRYTELSGNWGITINDENSEVEDKKLTSKWCVPMYYFSDLSEQLKIEKFSERKDDLIKLVDYKIFYTHDPNLDFNCEKDIVFPSTIDNLFEKYFNLDTEIKKYIDAAISYTVSAIELKDTKRTLSLLASFTSMETMVNLEYENSKKEYCLVCNQQKYGISKKFRDYLLKYIGTSDVNKKKFNSYYSLRSKIIHTGKQLKTEKLFVDIPKNEKDIENITRIEILQIGKLAICNWLLANNK